MANVKRRYRPGIAFNEAMLKNLVSQDTNVIVTTKDYIDIQVNDNIDGVLESLDEAMAQKGFYYDPNLRVQFRASSRFMGKELIVTSETWIDVESSGIVTNPAFFAYDVTKIRGRLNCCVKTEGTGAALKLICDDLNGTVVDMMSAPYEFPDTEGEWKMFDIDTDIPPPTGNHEYKVQVMKGDADSMSLRSGHLIMLELDYVS